MDKALKALSDRFKSNDLNDSNPQGGKRPPYKNDYPARLAIDNNINRSNGPDQIIDTQFDYRNPLIFVVTNIVHEYPDIVFKDHPCMTPTSFVGYNMALLYAMALLNDDENVRQVRSTHSREFSTDRLLSPILTALRNLYVPPFMHQILKGLTSSTDERKPNLRFVYSLACFDMTHDFGRSFPINMFFSASKLIATRAANTPPDQIIQAWLETQVIAQPIERTVAQYIGMNPADPYDTNWLSNCLLRVFNPVTSRSNTLRPTFDIMNLKSQIHRNTNADTINPYVYLLCMDPQNRKSTIAILNSISNAVQANFPQAKRLSELQSEEATPQLLNHYYQGLIQPTYHALQLSSTTEPKVNLSDKQQFMQRPKINANVDLKTFDKTKSIVQDWLYLAENTPREPKNDPIVYEEFNPSYPPIDNLRHFLPNDTKPQNVYINIISGKMIEFAELDSVAIPHPNPNNTVDKENCFFLESALPMSHIRPIIVGDNEIYDVVQRTPVNIFQPPVRIDLLDRTVDRLPEFGPRLVANFDDHLPGFHLTRNLSHTQFSCNSLGYTIDLEGNTSIIPLGIRKPPAWSCYRYLNSKPHDVTNIRDRKFMILNLRTIYGLNVTLQETRHPSEVICIS